MTNRKIPLVLSLLTLLPLSSCNQYVKGTILFDLNGGTFSSSFNVDQLTGRAGDRVETTIPDPTREGYYFVGWREKRTDGRYNSINVNIDEEGQEYYRYPYGTVTFYAYFEPLVTLSFDLTEGTDRGGRITAPVNSNADFNVTSNLLSGYTSLEIPSVDYLPTATAEHLQFEYWYTKYPLVRVTDDEQGTTHYALDTSAQEGKYRFDTGFSGEGYTGPMQFPEVDGGTNFTLYASWVEDPKVNLHFNIEGVDDVSFLISPGTLVSTELYDVVREAIGIDLSATGYKYYQGGELRFDGMFLDAEMETPFPVDATTPIQNENLDIYFAWNKRVELTLDYGEGSLNGQSSFVTDDYYEGDILGEGFASSHRPSKEFATFEGFSYQGEPFSFNLDPLPSTNDGKVLLTAIYDDYPTLQFVTDFPDNTTDIYSNVYHLEAGTDISDLVRSYIDLIPSYSDLYTLYSVEYANYQEDGTLGTHQPLGIEMMPTDNSVIFINLGYKTQVNLFTYIGSKTDGNYAVNETVYPVSTTYYGIQVINDKNTLDIITEEKLNSGFNTETVIDIGGVSYLYDGIHSTYEGNRLYSDFGEEFLVSGPTINRDTIHVLNLYRRVTKAIQVTLVRNSSLGSFYALPGADISSVLSKIREIYPDFDPAKNILVDSNGVEYSNILPDNDIVLSIQDI